MKKLLMLLTLFSLCFATDGDMGWQVFAFLGAFIALMVLLIIYMLSYLVDSREMRLLATQELYQIGIALVFIVLFTVLQTLLDTYVSGPLGETFSTADFEVETLMDGAKAVSQGIADYEWQTLQTLTNDVTIPLGSLASLSATCSFLGTTFSYPGCIGIQVPTTSMIFATNVLMSALLVQNSQTMLLNLAENFFFPVLLPIGIFMRSFQFTRGAGGLLIAIAFAFYFIFPFAVIMTKGMVDMVGMPDSNFPNISAPTQDYDMGGWEVEGDCNPFDMKPKYTIQQVDNVLKDDFVDPLLFHFFIGGLFTSMLNILVTLSAVRGLASIFGAEVDISALARIS
jgi:hypothetical protein